MVFVLEWAGPLTCFAHFVMIKGFSLDDLPGGACGWDAVRSVVVVVLKKVALGQGRPVGKVV